MSQSVRILIAESGSGFGGSAKYLAGLLPLLDRDRFRMNVVAYGDGPFIRRVKEEGWPVLDATGWRFSWEEGPAILANLLRLFWLVPLIALRLRREKIRLVHLNNEILSHLPLLLAARLAGCHVVCHLHGWRGLIRLERFFISCVDEFVCISEAGAKFFTADIGRPVTAIPNGLSMNGELRDFDAKRGEFRKELGLLPGQKLVSMVGRLVAWKGQRVFLQALAKVIQKSGNVYGLIVGHDETPDQSYLESLQEMATSLGIRDRIHFLAWREDIWPIYAASDIVIHASTLPEPFGLVILEAMGAGRPVIATRGGGVNDLVIDGETGLLIEPDNVQALAEAIDRLIREPEFASHLAAEGEARAKINFTMDKNTAGIQKIYRDLLNGTPAGTAKSRIKETLFQHGAIRLLRNSLASRAPILMYHRIFPTQDPFFPSVSERTFREQMRYIKRHYQILPLDRLVNCWRSGERLPSNSIAVTLDDGDALTWKTAYPILKELEIPATFFLTTGPPDDGGFIWTDLLRWWLKLTPLKHLAIPLNGYRGKWPLETLEDRLHAARELSQKLKKAENQKRLALLADLEEALGVKRSSLPKHWTLHWDEVRAMRSPSVAFGAHSITHSILSLMNDQEARYEITQSKQRLEAMIDEPVRHFAYPNGEPSDFTAEHEKMVAGAGFDSACSAIQGLNDHRTNRYALRRIYAAEEPLATFASRLVGVGS